MVDDQSVRVLLRRVADAVPEDLYAPVTQLISRGRVSERRRRWLLAAGTGLAVALAIFLPVALVNSGTDTVPTGGPSPIATPDHSAPYPSTGPGSADALARDHWSLLPASPIPGRENPADAWTGQQMLIWGGATGPQGQDLRADGAEYDPATRQWSLLPDSPLSPRTDMASVWTGRQWLLWGGYDRVSVNDFHAADDGALYDPAKRSWQPLPAAPLTARVYATALWTGSQVLVLGGQPPVLSDQQRADLDGATWDPRTNRWHLLPPMPTVAGHSPVDRLTAVAAGGSVYVWMPWQHTVQSGNEWSATTGIDVWRYNTAADSWATVHSEGDVPAGVGDPLWTGEEVIMPASPRICAGSCPPDHGFTGHRLDPQTQIWQALALGPLDNLHPQSLWTGAALLDFNTGTYTAGSPDGTNYPGEAAVWDPDNNSWTRLPNAPYVGSDGVASVWTGRELLQWGEMSPGHVPGGRSSRANATVGQSYGP
jgi:hypothetical protein